MTDSTEAMTVMGLGTHINAHASAILSCESLLDSEQESFISDEMVGCMSIQSML